MWSNYRISGSPSWRLLPDVLCVGGDVRNGRWRLSSPDGMECLRWRGRRVEVDRLLQITWITSSFLCFQRPLRRFWRLGLNIIRPTDSCASNVTTSWKIFPVLLFTVALTWEKLFPWKLWDFEASHLNPCCRYPNFWIDEVQELLLWEVCFLVQD